MRFELPEKERKLFREIQRNEKYKRDYVKATILVMPDSGETPSKIALFLGIDDGTIYRRLEKEAAEVHYFIDAAHPALNSEADYGWIEKSTEYQVLSNSGRTRMNILGALNSNEMTDLITKEYKTSDSEAAQDLLKEPAKRIRERRKSGYLRIMRVVSRN